MCVRVRLNKTRSRTMTFFISFVFLLILLSLADANQCVAVSTAWTQHKHTQQKRRWLPRLLPFITAESLHLTSSSPSTLININFRTNLDVLFPPFFCVSAVCYKNSCHSFISLCICLQTLLNVYVSNQRNFHTMSRLCAMTRSIA